MRRVIFLMLLICSFNASALAYTKEEIWNHAVNQSQTKEAKSVKVNDGQIILENTNQSSSPKAKKDFFIQKEH